MKRTARIAATLILAAVALTAAVAVAAPGVYDQLWGDGIEADLCFLADGADLPSTDCTPETPTTTTEPTATTTTPPVLVIPPTQPYPARGSGVPYAEGGGYDIMAINADTGLVWWVAPYWGANGLAMYPGQGGWVDGDRQGYACGYGFIEDDDGSIDGRFAFVRPPNQAYGKVNDAYMAEGQRYLDGTIASEGQEIGSEDCTDVLSDIDYAGACRDVDERPRIGFFDANGNVLDIRDYSNTNANGVVFNLHSATEDRVTVIACEDGLVGMVVYYDALGDGSVAADLEGVPVTP